MRRILKNLYIASLMGVFVCVAGNLQAQENTGEELLPAPTDYTAEPANEPEPASIDGDYSGTTEEMQQTIESYDSGDYPED